MDDLAALVAELTDRQEALAAATAAQETERESLAALVRSAKDRRDDLIRQFHTSGVSLRTIAAAAGLSHTAVHRIVTSNDVEEEQTS